MHVPIEYIILAAVAAILLIVLICLLCYLFCCRSGGLSRTAEEPDITAVAYVPAKIEDASVYVTVPEQIPDRRREATPTELHMIGYTPTQLLENEVVREATKTELLKAGYTPQQLEQADIIPKQKSVEKKQKAPRSVFSAKPLKFDSRAEEDDGQMVRGKGKKRPAINVDEERTDRKKRSPPPGRFDAMFANSDPKPEMMKHRRTSSGTADRRRTVSDEKVGNRRTVIRDSKEKIAAKPLGMDLTTLF